MKLKSHLQSIREKNGMVLIFGLGLSGIESALALSRLGIRACVYESRLREDFVATSPHAKRLSEIEDIAEHMYFGPDSNIFEREYELCLQSPGIPLDSKLSEDLRKRGIRISNELEFGLSLLNSPSIIITGSIGKSTVTSLAHQLLQHAGKNSLLCGNIGHAVSSFVSGESLQDDYECSYEYLVVEASSYQIESSTELHPQIGALLNVSENHLERHGTLDEILRVKSKIFALQNKDDLAVLALHDARVRNLKLSLQARVLFFGKWTNAQQENGCYYELDPEQCRDDLVVLQNGESCRVSLREYRLLGEHNRLNLAAAATVVMNCGVTPEILQSSISSLQSLEHRLETVATGQGVFINDSKSTTAPATTAALSAVRAAHSEAPIVLLCGGQMKSGQQQVDEWERIFLSLDRDHVITFGQDGQRLAEIARKHGARVQCFPGLRDAIQHMKKKPEPAQVVVFSPGCASFDEFTDFGQRGNVFKSLITT